MARIHGRRGRIYLGIADDTATAEPLPYFATWQINHSVDKSDVTSLGDTHKTYTAGLPDASGSFSGFFDSATAQTYTAATDGKARKWYLYPDTSTNTTYWFGTILVDMTIDGSVSDSVKVSANWAAASTVAKVTS